MKYPFFLLIGAFLAGCASNPIIRPPQRLTPVTTWGPSGEGKVCHLRDIEGGSDLAVPPGYSSALRKFIVGSEKLQLGRPHGIHIDTRGRAFVTEPEGHRVHFFDPRTNEYQIITAPQSTELQCPIGVTSDDDGHVFISDSASGQIYRYTLESKLLEPFGPKLSRPTGIAYDGFLSRVYVVETLAHRVIVLDQAGREIKRIGTRGEHDGEFNFPTDIAINGDGELLVNDTLNSRIQVFKPDGSFVRSFGGLGNGPGKFTRAKGITTDSRGWVYVSDVMTDTIQIFDCRGEFLTTFGKSGSEPGEFWMPIGIFIDEWDHLWVVDAYNSRIQLFQGLEFAVPRD